MRLPRPAATRLSTVALKLGHLRQSALVTFGAAKTRGQKSCDQFLREHWANHPATQAHHVHVVVFDSLVCREAIVDKRRATPAILFAAIDAPTPLPHTATPRSTSPRATASAIGTTKSG